MDGPVADYIYLNYERKLWRIVQKFKQEHPGVLEEQTRKRKEKERRKENED